MSRPHLLDTGVLLLLVRGGDDGQRIDEKYGLRASIERPFICVVTHGEIRSMARRNRWGGSKLTVLEEALRNLVTIDINHPRVIDAYVEIEHFSQSCPGGARNMGKNDLWIAACAMAADTPLLTTDADFAHLDPSHVCVHQAP